MKQLKTIKSNLKAKGKYKEYKNKFAHKQMRLATTKIALVFNKDIKIHDFTEIEVELINKDMNEKMFEDAFKLVDSQTGYKADWESLGKFMWFQYQVSTYYKDKKRGVENIYNSENIIDINAVKRGHYLKWLHSLDKNDQEFNNKIIEVSKIIL